MASILVVEDEPTVLVLGESVLQRAGYETLIAGTLAEAQAVIHSDQRLDLVFTDITLPENPEAACKWVNSCDRRDPELSANSRQRSRPNAPRPPNV